MVRENPHELKDWVVVSKKIENKDTNEIFIKAF